MRCDRAQTPCAASHVCAAFEVGDVEVQLQRPLGGPHPREVVAHLGLGLKEQPLAARVKVNATTALGATPSARSAATRCATVSVLPEPALATT